MTVRLSCISHFTATAMLQREAGKSGIVQNRRLMVIGYWFPEIFGKCLTYSSDHTT